MLMQIGVKVLYDYYHLGDEGSFDFDIKKAKKVAKEEMNFKKAPESMNRDELTKLIADIQKKMQKAAADLNFEAAAEYRDKMVELKGMLRDM